MDAFTAHGLMIQRLNAMRQAGELDEHWPVANMSEADWLTAPAMMVAAADLGFGLGWCETEQDLDESVRRYMRLRDAGMIDPAELEGRAIWVHGQVVAGLISRGMIPAE